MNGDGKTTHMNETEPYLTPSTKINSKWKSQPISPIIVLYPGTYSLQNEYWRRDTDYNWGMWRRMDNYQSSQSLLRPGWQDSLDIHTDYNLWFKGSRVGKSGRHLPACYWAILLQISNQLSTKHLIISQSIPSPLYLQQWYSNVSVHQNHLKGL